MSKAQKQKSKRQGISAAAMHNNRGAHNGRSSLPRDGLNKPNAKRHPKIFTRNIFMIIGLNFLITSLMIGTTIYVASQYDSHRSKSSTTTTAEAQIEDTTYVAYVQGDAEYLLNQVWVPLTTSQKIGESDSVRTVADSRLIISLPDGSTIRLSGDTTITFTRLTSEEIIISNQKGRVYARVAPDAARSFMITVEESEFTAIGTAYETFNTDYAKGVRVYDSIVKTKAGGADEQLVTAGQQYYVSNEDKTKTATITNLDSDELSNDEFVLWNKQQDEADPAYKDALGFLKKVGVKSEKPAETVTSNDAIVNTGGQGIALYGTRTNEGIKLSWNTNALDTQWGFKVNYSSTDTTPSHKEAGSTSEYASKEASSAFVSITDGRTWHFRICAYQQNGTCVSYSNSVTITAPLKVKTKVTHGAMTASLGGNTLNWSYTGLATYGYKINWNTSGSPTYPAEGGAENAGSKYISNGNTTSLNLESYITAAGTYYINVCAYTDGTESTACVDYTNVITYVRS